MYVVGVNGIYPVFVEWFECGWCMLPMCGLVVDSSCGVVVPVNGGGGTWLLCWVGRG